MISLLFMLYLDYMGLSLYLLYTTWKSTSFFRIERDSKMNRFLIKIRYGWTQIALLYGIFQCGSSMIGSLEFSYSSLILFTILDNTVSLLGWIFTPETNPYRKFRDNPQFARMVITTRISTAILPPLWYAWGLGTQSSIPLVCALSTFPFILQARVLEFPDLTNRILSLRSLQFVKYFTELPLVQNLYTQCVAHPDLIERGRYGFMFFLTGMSIYEMFVYGSLLASVFYFVSILYTGAYGFYFFKRMERISRRHHS